MSNDGNGHDEKVVIDRSLLALRESAALTWVSAAPPFVPTDAIVGGKDNNGSSLYVARADYHSGVQPGKATADVCYISYGGDEKIIRTNYELLTGQPSEVQWISVTGRLSLEELHGAIPVAAGREGSTTLYSCRTEIDSSLQVGKVWFTSNAHIPYGGKEVTRDEYEVMCYA